jgi:hypothetical protein
VLEAFLTSLEVCKDDSAGKKCAAVRNSTVGRIFGAKFFPNVFISLQNCSVKMLANGTERNFFPAAFWWKASSVGQITLEEIIETRLAVMTAACDCNGVIREVQAGTTSSRCSSGITAESLPDSELFNSVQSGCLLLHWRQWRKIEFHRIRLIFTTSSGHACIEVDLVIPI